MSRKFLNFLRNNFSSLVDVATAAAALFIVLRSINTPLTAEQFYGWMLTIVALLAISGLSERLLQINKIRENSETAVSLLGRWPSPGRQDTFLKTYDKLTPLDDRLRGVQTIWISGRTLSSMFGIYRDLFRQKIVNDDCKMRVLIVDPGGIIPQAEARQHHDEASLQDCVAKGQSSIACLRVLRRDIHGKEQNLEVKVLDYSPRFGLMITDPESMDGVVQVQLLPHWRTTWGRPIFRITKSEDQRWFGEFVQQFEQLWKAGSPVQWGTEH